MAGWRIVHNDFQALKHAFGMEVDDIIGTAAFMVQDHAQSPPPQGGPVDTGTMVGEVTVSHEEGSYYAETNANADYSGWVNYGTRYMPANNWFDRAVQYASEFYWNELADLESRLR